LGYLYYGATTLTQTDLGYFIYEGTDKLIIHYYNGIGKKSVLYFNYFPFGTS